MNDEIINPTWNGQPSWALKGLGTEIDVVPVDRVLSIAGLNWTVGRQPASFRHKNVWYDSGKIVLFRPGSKEYGDPNESPVVLTVVSDDWSSIQNKEAFEYFQTIATTGLAGSIEWAGKLRDGEAVWALARLQPKDGSAALDPLDSYLLFTNSHQYGKSIDIRHVLVRRVNWTFVVVGKDVVIKDMTDVADQAKRSRIAAVEWHAWFSGIQAHLTAIKYDQETLKNYLAECFHSGHKEVAWSKPAQKALEVMDTQPGHELGAGTWWQAYNAVAFCMDHILGHSPETRLNSAWYGVNRKRKFRALDLAYRVAHRR